MARYYFHLIDVRQTRLAGTSSAENIETDPREAGESELARGGWRHIDDAAASDAGAILFPSPDEAAAPG